MSSQRFFKVELSVLNNIREQLMSVLQQPNGAASEPWAVDGDHHDESHGYVALGAHHTTGQPWEDFVNQFIELDGVQEISEIEYFNE